MSLVKKTRGVGDGGLAANLGRRLVLIVPYAWLILFFAIPFLIVVKISISVQRDGRPP